MAKIMSKRTFLCATIVVAALCSTQAYAQSGSRLCGWTSISKDFKIGLLYEARTSYSTYTRECNEVIDEMKKAIEGDKTLNAMSWDKISKQTCETVGTSFLEVKMKIKGRKVMVVPSGVNKDICENMKARKPYKVTKSGDASIVYERIEN